MSELANIVAHYLEQIAKRAGINDRGQFGEIRAEIDAAVEADKRVADKRFDALCDEINRIEEKVDRPDWRERR